MFLDTRLGNTPRWFLTKPKDWGMRIPESVRKSVVFLGRVINKGTVEEFHFAGTGFFVLVPSETRDSSHLCLVTAKHVAMQLLLGNWVMRINTKNGAFKDFRGDKTHKWWFHPNDESVDVAVTPMGKSDEMDLAVIPESMFLDDKTIAENNIGPGDEVFVTGLFNRMRGRSRNLPIVRTGNVCLIPPPGELVPGVAISPGVGVDAEAYLIEARSTGGLSGSPVFVRETIDFELPAPASKTASKTGQVPFVFYPISGQFYLLGLVHGHWEIYPEDANEINPRFTKKTEKEAVNLGIAVVVPAKKIRDTLHHPELIALRKEWERNEIAAEGTTTPD